MLQFWCLSPVRVAYHGSFIWSQHFGALGCHIAAWLGRCKSSKKAPLEFCSFDASPQSEWLITAHLERIWGQHFGALDCHITTWLSTCKSSKRALLEYCSFDVSPQSEWLITAHLGRIWNHYFGALDCHMSYHNLMKHMQVFETEHLKCCSFDASPQS